MEKQVSEVVKIARLSKGLSGQLLPIPSQSTEAQSMEAQCQQ